MKPQEIMEKALEELKSLSDSNALNEFRVKYLGKKGEITGLMKQMKDLSAEEKPVFGQAVNNARKKIEEAIDETLSAIAKKEREKAGARPFCAGSDRCSR